MGACGTSNFDHVLLDLNRVICQAQLERPHYNAWDCVITQMQYDTFWKDLPSHTLSEDGQSQILMQATVFKKTWRTALLFPHFQLRKTQARKSKVEYNSACMLDLCWALVSGGNYQNGKPCHACWMTADSNVWLTLCKICWFSTVFSQAWSTDFGMLTLLRTSDVGGLQVKPDGYKEWLPVDPPENSYIINIGMTLVFNSLIMLQTTWLEQTKWCVALACVCSA